MVCRLWNVIVPVWRYGTLNLFCNKYQCEQPSGPGLKELLPHMEDGYIYGIFYNDIGRPEMLRKLYDLRLQLFTDGRAQPVGSIEHGGVTYKAPHFRHAVSSDQWEECRQTGGHIEAHDTSTGELMWSLRVYETEYDPWESHSEQDVFVTSIELSNGKLIVTNEKQERYEVDPESRQVTTL